MATHKRWNETSPIVWRHDERGRRISCRSVATRPQRDYVAPDGTFYTPTSLAPYIGHDFDTQRFIRTVTGPYQTLRLERHDTQQMSAD